MKIKWLSKKRPEPPPERKDQKQYCTIDQFKMFHTRVGCQSIEVKAMEDCIVISMSNLDDDRLLDSWCIGRKDVPPFLKILQEAMDSKPLTPIKREIKR